MSLRAAKVLATAICLGLVLAASSISQTKAAGVRSITVTSEPQAKVWVDGILYGTTSETGSLTITTISPGRKTIRVRADGFKETQKPLAATQTGAVSIPLVKTTDEAELAFQNGERLATIDREKAAEAYKQAAKLRPGYVDAYIGLARIYSETNDYENAQKAIAAARRAKPGLAEVSAIEGRLLKGGEDEAKAIAAFKRAIREGGGFQPEAYTGLGLLYKERAEGFGASNEYAQETANYAEAAKNLSTALKQLSGAPDSVVLYQFLGLVYEQQKQPQKAIAVYQEFLKYFPDHPEADAFRSFITQLKKQASDQ